jgi:hypothetical protein
MRKMKWHWCDGMWAKRFEVKGVRACVDDWGRVSLRQLFGRGGGGGARGIRNMSPKLDMFRRVRFWVCLPKHENLCWVPWAEWMCRWNNLGAKAGYYNNNRSRNLLFDGCSDYHHNHMILDKEPPAQVYTCTLVKAKSWTNFNCLRASPALLSMWPCNNILHIQV